MLRHPTLHKTWTPLCTEQHLRVAGVPEQLSLTACLSTLRNCKQCAVRETRLGVERRQVAAVLKEAHSGGHIVQDPRGERQVKPVNNTCGRAVSVSI